MSIRTRKIIRTILMAFLVINFVVLVIALTNIIEQNPLKEYRLILGISFIALGGFTRQVCKNCEEQKE